MNIAFSALPAFVEHEGRRRRLYPYFNRILAVLTIQEDPNIFDSDKIEAACSLIVDGPPSVALYEKALTAIIGQQDKPESDEPPTFDFLQDADLIYAAFRQTYGIDLRTQCDVMHWRVFIALFNGLPDGTRFSQVVHIRTCDMPKPTSENGEQRAKLAKLKAIYAIREPEGAGQRRFARKMQALANSFIQKAGEKT